MKPTDARPTPAPQPLPWLVEQCPDMDYLDGCCSTYDIRDAAGTLVVTCLRDERASVDSIVRAVNHHAALVEALTDLANHLDDEPGENESAELWEAYRDVRTLMLRGARAVLAAVEGAEK